MHTQQTSILRLIWHEVVWQGKKRAHDHAAKYDGIQSEAEMFKLLVDIKTKFGKQAVRLATPCSRARTSALGFKSGYESADHHVQSKTSLVRSLTPLSLGFMGAKQSRNKHKSEQKPFVTLASDG